MKWYRTADHDELINLEIVESVRLKEKSINFDFYGEESRFIAEIFETEERAKKCFNKIASKLVVDDFAY